MWANMAEKFGLYAAGDPNSYIVANRAQEWLEGYSDKVPELKWLHAIKNQGHGDAIRGGRSRAEGVKAGVFDTFLPVPRYNLGQGVWLCGFYIELKRLSSFDKKAGIASDIQKEFKADMEAAGYKAEVLYGWEDARDNILRYLGRL